MNEFDLYDKFWEIYPVRIKVPYRALPREIRRNMEAQNWDHQIIPVHHVDRFKPCNGVGAVIGFCESLNLSAEHQSIHIDLYIEICRQKEAAKVYARWEYSD